MAKLVLRYNGHVISEHILDRGILTIGGDPDCDIHIDHPGVSEKHAKVLTILDKSFIEDLDSKTGTYVNGNRISGHALKDDESVFISEHELTYVNNDVEIGESDFVYNMNKRQHAGTAASAGQTPQSGTDVTPPAEKPGSVKAGPGGAKLLIISGPNKGQEQPLTKVLTTVGKPGVQVAAVTRRSSAWYLITIEPGKENKKPLVNGSEIRKEHILTDDDVIEVAGVQMRFVKI